MNNHRYVCGILMDFEKAFDIVNHAILCDKLNLYGFRYKINKLFENYLDNTKQFLSINGFDFAHATIKCGVPQGPSLGPLLFLIYYLKLKLAILLMIPL